MIDRANYNKALAVIQSDVAAAKPESVNRTRLIRTINNMNDEYGSLGNGASRIWILDGRTIGGAWGAQDLPFIDQLYASIVYGQLPLGVAEIEKLNETFFRGSESVPRMYAWGIQQEKYNLVAHDVRTQFDAENGVYKSWVDLQIQYTGGSGRRSSVFFDSRLPSSREFSAEFDFPEGNFITDYYLYVGHENKQGILSEKRAAQLIYKQIVNRAQDPGIVSYSGDGKISLKVFPFADGEIRKTGFQVMHIEPLVLNILGQEISLDCAAQNNAVHVSGDMEGHSLRCTAESCTSILPLTGNAYDDAMVLRHNTKVQPEPIERVKESFEQRVLTDRTTFIVLESAQQEQQLRAWLEEHKQMPGVTMPALQKAQEIYGYLPIEVQRIVADVLGKPLAEIYGISTFYSQFSLCPKGEYKISVCLGTACYVKGSGKIYDELQKKLGITGGECTADGKFSLDACRCIGACGLAPVMTINDDVYGRLTGDELDGILAKY